MGHAFLQRKIINSYRTMLTYIRNIKNLKTKEVETCMKASQGSVNLF